MRTLMTSVCVLALAAFFAPTVDAAPDGWHPNLEKGLEAAKKSGKPLLVVTGWAPNI